MKWYQLLPAVLHLVSVYDVTGCKSKENPLQTLWTTAVILFCSCSSPQWVHIDPLFRSNFLISLPVPLRKMDAKSAHPISYTGSKTNIGISAGRHWTWLIAIPCSSCFAQVHNRIWTKHERKPRTNMRKHNVIVSQQNALTYWLWRSAC